MMKKQRTKAALLNEEYDRHPVFMSATPQFMVKASRMVYPGAKEEWDYCMKLDLDVMQVGHPSFYPVRVLDLPIGAIYKDDFLRTHVITKYYDEFTAPFPLLSTSRLDLNEVRDKWDSFEFPDPAHEKWFTDLDTIAQLNEALDDPPSIWGVTNGPFEPTWQLLSDGWPAFYILARRDEDLALEIIDKVATYVKEAGQEMIRRGADAIRIGDDHGLNEGPMVSRERWATLVKPALEKVVGGLKKTGGTDFPVILHSDGDIRPLIDEFISAGIDALNPVQPGVLDFEEIVENHGDDMAMTGAFDLRHFLLPRNGETVALLQQETRKLFDVIAKARSRGQSTGFCIGPSHQVQPGSHVDTFEEWVNIVHELNEKNQKKP